jgi:proline iminopeptidase
MLHGVPRAPTRGMHRLLDPAVWRTVVIHQRNCGRSPPSAADPSTEFAGPTTASLVADMERVREHRGVDRWLVFGASWGTTLGLAHAQVHPERVSRWSCSSRAGTGPDPGDSGGRVHAACISHVR